MAPRVSHGETGFTGVTGKCYHTLSAERERVDKSQK
jgi:hypothetical protein